MGLDAGLVGITDPEATGNAHEEGRLTTFASWRKHWHLHSYIVEKFGGGFDEYDKHHCISVGLSANDLKAILAALETGELKPYPKPRDYDPVVARLFGEEIIPDDVIFRRALAWLEGGNRAISYGAND